MSVIGGYMTKTELKEELIVEKNRNYSILSLKIFRKFNLGFGQSSIRALTKLRCDSKIVLFL